MELNTAGHKSPVFRGTRRAPLYPSMIDEAIIGENEDGTEITEGAYISICRIIITIHVPSPGLWLITLLLLSFNQY